MVVGDSVIILAEYPPGLPKMLIPSGTIGTVYNVRDHGGADVSYLVAGEKYRFGFYAHEIMLQTPKFLTPEMELSEIEEAGLLMEQLKA